LQNLDESAFEGEYNKKNLIKIRNQTNNFSIDGLDFLLAFMLLPLCLKMESPRFYRFPWKGWQQGHAPTPLQFLIL
jgi:hypothetical protein